MMGLMDAMTPEQIDAAARILCHNEGHDPEGMFVHANPRKSRTYFQIHGNRYRERIQKRFNELDAIERVISAAERAEETGSKNPSNI